MAIIETNQGPAVVTGPVTVLWDGISRPEATEANDKHPAGWKYTVRFAIPTTDPAYGEFKQMVDAQVKAAYPTGTPRTFQHTLQIEDGSGHPELIGQAICTATTFSAPTVYAADGQPVAPQACGLYGGAIVRLILKPRVYNGKGNIGSGAWLNGTQLVDLTTPHLSGSGGAGLPAAAAASAFGFQTGAAAFATPPTAAPVAQAPAPATPPAAPTPAAPNPGIVPPVPTAKMTAAGQTVESFIAAGWTVEQMRAEGYVI